MKMFVPAIAAAAVAMPAAPLLAQDQGEDPRPAMQDHRHDQARDHRPDEAMPDCPMMEGEEGTCPMMHGHGAHDRQDVEDAAAVPDRATP